MKVDPAYTKVIYTVAGIRRLREAGALNWECVWAIDEGVIMPIRWINVIPTRRDWSPIKENPVLQVYSAGELRDMRFKINHRKKSRTAFKLGYWVTPWGSRIGRIQREVLDYL